jgi:apolipoprotein N-acyltransferase
VGVVQGNIDQAQKWDPEYRERTLATYFSLTEALAEKGLDLAVWPETAMPFAFQDPVPERALVEAFARQAAVPLLFGAPAYAEGPKGDESRNAVFLVDREGRASGRYDKMHLVPFGEYVPLGRYLPFLSKLVQGVGDFTPGPGLRPLALSPAGPAVGPLVCFEVIFPALAAEHAAKGAQVLAVVTNDGWFGRTSGPYQHLAFAAWRAAETGLPLVRAANTGVSAVFDGRGKLLAATALGARDAFAATVEVAAPRRTPQGWVRPWVGPLCLALALPAVFAMVRPPSAPGDRRPRRAGRSRRGRDRGEP